MLKESQCFKVSLFIRSVMTLLIGLTLIESVRASDLNSPLAKLELKDGDCIVFYGDSITHQRLYTQFVENYFYTRFPNMRLKIHNAGVSGDVAWESLERFDKDVAAYQPKYVTVLLGMNDGNHEPFNQLIFSTYRRDMTTIFQNIKEIGAAPILMTPTMFDARVRHEARPSADPDSTELYNAVLAYYGAWLREVAMEEGYGFVDLWAPMNDFVLDRRKTDAKFTLVPDAVHPNPNGHLIMAVSMIRDFGLSREVSVIRVLPGGENGPNVDAKGGQISDVKRRDDRLEFSWQAQSLPWVLPDQEKLDEGVMDIANQVNVESLEVHGLSPGMYSLTIDGVNVATYENTELERRVELQLNSKTPQYQQAKVVANMNKKRNEGPINAMRDEWWNFQTYSDARRSAKENPYNIKFKKAFDEAEKKIRGMDQRIADDNAQAKSIEDEIFKSNKPPLRKYVLVKTESKRN